MKWLVLSSTLLLGCIVLVPGVHVVENAFMIAEAGSGFWVPQASSLVSFECTESSDGGNATYCLFGRDWANYYAACDPAEKRCSGGFTAYSKAAAERCVGFEPHDVRTWCETKR